MGPIEFPGEGWHRVPETMHLIRFFNWQHLPEPLQRVSRPFFELAAQVVAEVPDGPELTVCLRKLLEAKDCAVRAAL